MSQLGIFDRASIFAPKASSLYRSFLSSLSSWRDNKTIADYRAVPYDWRLRLDDILQTVNKDGRVMYQGATTYKDSYIYETLKDLVETSYSGSVTIVTHSNGGLLAKIFLDAMARNNDPLLDNVDNLILVGVPQVGTPSSVVSMLHGDSVGPRGWVVSQEMSRTLLNTMPFGHHLLPHEQYFDEQNITIDTSVIRFEPGTTTDPWREQFGQELTDQSSLRAFLYADGERATPEDGDLASPAVLEDSLVRYANVIQTIVGNWQPPHTMQVYQVAGTGLLTPARITYFNKEVCEQRQLLMPWRCADYGDALGYRVEHARDGDGTVLAPSAVAMSESSQVERWWINLFEYNDGNTNRSHKNLLEIPEMSTFLLSTINRTSTAYQYLTKEQPVLADSGRLVFQLHSPLDMQVVDTSGNRVSSSTEDIVGGMYRRYGELQYISVPKTDEFKVILTGESTGSFTLELEEWLDEDRVERVSFSAIPSSTSTVVTVMVGDGLSDVVLDMDYTGGGEVVLEILQTGEVRELILKTDNETDASTEASGRSPQSNPVTRASIVNADVAGVAVDGVSDAEQHDYYQELFRLLNELKVLLEIFENNYVY